MIGRARSRSVIVGSGGAGRAGRSRLTAAKTTAAIAAATVARSARDSSASRLNAHHGASAYSGWENANRPSAAQPANTTAIDTIHHGVKRSARSEAWR